MRLAQGTPNAGAETAVDLAWLRANDCDMAQGYGIAKPMPADELPGWLVAFGVRRWKQA